MKMTTETFQVLALTPEGQPLPAGELGDAMMIDLEGMPAFEHHPVVEGGVVTLPVPDEPFGICLPMPIEGFGHVYVFADNGGRGCEPAQVRGRILNFVLDAAASRIVAVEARAERARAEGSFASGDWEKCLGRAQGLLEDARTQQGDDVSCTRLATQSLAAGMRAGESLAITCARTRIAGAGPRPEFRFGCNGFGYPRQGARYAEAFAKLFDFVTLPFYRGGTEKEEGKRDFSRVERILEWTGPAGIPAKGHPLVWFHWAGIPDWLRGKSYEEVAATHRDYIADAVGRFRDRIKIWDVINEAHDWANELGYSAEQLNEMTRLAAEATREADPEAVRIVNNCETWGQYVALGWNYAGKLNRPVRHVLRYLRELEAAGVEYEVIGLQMYAPQRDLLEIERQLDRFVEFVKPIHITELGVPSLPTAAQDPKNQEALDKITLRQWHGRPWSRTEQADWVEGYYTLCYAHPAVEAVTWWDLSDPAFIAGGGLLDEELKEKEAYRWLEGLIGTWRRS